MSCFYSRVSTAVVLLMLASAALPIARADWSTSQGNLRRSGFLDDRDGPRDPRVLWSLPGRSNYVAAPALTEDTLFVPSLGAFQSPECAAIALDPKASDRLRWSLTSPAFGVPTAAPPVVRNGVVYVGEGMHTNLAGALTAVDATRGLPLWRFVVEGDLCHVEAAATVDASGRIYFGAGSGGVFCLDGSRIRSGDKTRSVSEHRELVAREWNRLVEAHEKEKAEDPDFAIAPERGAVLDGLEPSIEKIWSVGKDELHVDASVALVDLVGGEGVRQKRLLVASAFLDEEQEGFRGIVCLDASDGSRIWEHRLAWNPWGAPSIARVEKDGETRQVAVTTSSSIRFDPSTLRGARGAVVAFDIATGDALWSYPVPGGVLGSAAIDPGRRRAVFGATDGKVRCLDLASGALVWEKRAAAPIFGGVAVDRNTVYAADLDAEVSAWSLAHGELRWKRNLSKDPRIGRSGRVYGAVTAAEGRLFVATHNLEGANTGEPAFVACLGDDEATSRESQGLVVDRKRRRLLIDVEIAPRKLPHLDQVYPIEVMATSPQGKKAHETVLVTDVRPSDVHRALESLGLVAGEPAMGLEQRPRGPEVALWIEYAGRAGLLKRIDLSRTVIDRRTGLPVESGIGSPSERIRWLFTGSREVESESADGVERLYGADLSGTLATLYSVTAETVFQSSLGMSAESFLSLEVAKFLPKTGTKAKLVVEPLVAKEVDGR